VAANGLLFQALGRTVRFPGRRGRTESWQGVRGVKLALGRAGFTGVRIESEHPALVVTARRPAAQPG
jgi:hypothetical protein